MSKSHLENFHGSNFLFYGHVTVFTMLPDRKLHFYKYYKWKYLHNSKSKQKTLHIPSFTFFLKNFKNLMQFLKIENITKIVILFSFVF